MNVDEFTSLLRNPENLEASTQTRQLEEVLEAYPWFQPARALYLKGLHQMNSYKYNPALKATAACTADREVLFDYITSDEFLQDSIAETLSEETPLGDTEIVSESVEPNPESDTGMVAQEKDSPLPRSAKEADRILDPGLFRSVDPEIDRKLEAARKKADLYPQGALLVLRMVADHKLYTKRRERRSCRRGIPNPSRGAVTFSRRTFNRSRRAVTFLRSVRNFHRTSNPSNF